VQLAQAQALAGFKEATDVRVAVIDSGCDNGHPTWRAWWPTRRITGTQVKDVQARHPRHRHHRARQ
jgi:hypothetical protein